MGFYFTLLLPFAAGTWAFAAPPPALPASVLWIDTAAACGDCLIITGDIPSAALPLPPARRYFLPASLFLNETPTQIATLIAAQTRDPIWNRPDTFWFHNAVIPVARASAELQAYREEALTDDHPREFWIELDAQLNPTHRVAFRAETLRERSPSWGNPFWSNGTTEKHIEGSFARISEPTYRATQEELTALRRERTPEGVSPGPPGARIDESRTLLGVEQTFQTATMVEEPGRNTMTTPHKKQKLDAFIQAYARELGLPLSAIAGWQSRNKVGYSLATPHGPHVANMEPVTIEVNTHPVRRSELVPTFEPVHRAAGRVGLVPYVNPAAERSGMGHWHIGGRRLVDSPFFRHPTLLRNLMVYLHQHPSVLYGFAEAYDVGPQSNIATHHAAEAEPRFREAVASFDRWYQNQRRHPSRLPTGSPAGAARVWHTSPHILDELPASLGLLHFLADYNNHLRFDHFRYVNLEHLQLIFDRPLHTIPDLTGKRTVELRNFRPARSAREVSAQGDLIFALLNYLSDPDRLVEFRDIGPERHRRFYLTSEVEADWENVRREIRLDSPEVDAMIEEYVRSTRHRRIQAGVPEGLELYPAHSEKHFKDTRFEVRVRATNPQPPRLTLEGRPIPLEPRRIRGEDYWIGMVDASAQQVNSRAIFRGEVAWSLSGQEICRPSIYRTIRNLMGI